MNMMLVLAIYVVRHLKVLWLSAVARQATKAQEDALQALRRCQLKQSAEAARKRNQDSRCA